jgi:selenocysteine lyase/cysteine desulfurase
VPNATTAINTVLRNLAFEKGHVIIYFETIYGACEKTVTYITETTPAESYRISYTYPISDALLVQKLADAIQHIRGQGKHPRIAIFDTVVSMPGVRMPYEALVRLCKNQQVMSFVDAAHGLGMLSSADLNLAKLQPDFFASNCHK